MAGEDHLKILSRVESYILPPNQQHGVGKFHLAKCQPTPRKRLDNMLYELALADHIRAMQTMYRDTNDELLLVSELRESKERIPMKSLLEKMCEGRSRIITLAKLCYSKNNVAILRSILDLASTYALQGLWQQAQDASIQAIEMLKCIEDQESRLNKISQAAKKYQSVALKVKVLFHVLRVHVINNQGVVTTEFIQELTASLAALESPDTQEIMALAQAIHIYLTSPNPSNAYNSNMFNPRFAPPALNAQQSKQGRKTWGDFVHYFRHQNELTMQWFEVVLHESILLPQNKATLLLPFRLTDPYARQLAHPQQLASLLLTFPSVAKLIGGSNLVKILQHIPVTVPMIVHADSGHVQPPLTPLDAGTPQDRYADAIIPPPGDTTISIQYELPMTVEEYLSLYVLECSNQAYTQLFNILKVQTLTLQGVCSIYLQKIALAEETLTFALYEVENAGLDMEGLSCELYNSIAQMMITKYQHWLKEKKARYQQEAETWIEQTEEGKKFVRLQLKIIKKQYNYSSPVVSVAEMEYRAKQLLLKKKLKDLFSKDEQENVMMKKMLEVSYRYLIRSHDILETLHGMNHPVVGTACLAIASVQNIYKDFEDTREWLLRAIRIFEKCTVPMIPYPAIAFANIQLAHALLKLDHETEAKKVMIKAWEFYHGKLQFNLQTWQEGTLQKEKEKLSLLDKEINYLSPKHYLSQGPGQTTSMPSHSQSHPPQPATTSQPPSPPQPSVGGKMGGGMTDIEASLMPLTILLKSDSMYEELQNFMNITHEVVELCVKTGDKWEACTYSEELSKSIETAFGWDTIETADAFRHTATKCANAGDWIRAMRYYHEAAQAYLILFGKNDQKYLMCMGFYEATKKKRQAAAQDKLLPQQEIEIITPIAPPSHQVTKKKTTHSEIDETATDITEPTEDDD